MPFRAICLSVLSVLVLSACAEMDDTVQTEQVVRAVVLDEDSNQQFVIELAYSDALTYEEAVVLVNDIAVIHEAGLTLTDSGGSVIETADSILYEQAEFSDLSDHVFQVTVYSEIVDLSQLIQQYRWTWVDREIVEFVKHCPPGHGG